MDDYIDREDLLKKLSEDCPQICDDKVDVYGIGAYNQYQGDIHTVVNMSSVDAVKVVRCKDCKDKSTCWIYDAVCEDDFFCKGGEKE